MHVLQCTIQNPSPYISHICDVNYFCEHRYRTGLKTFFQLVPGLPFQLRICWFCCCTCVFFLNACHDFQGSWFHIRSPQLFVCRPLLVILLMAIRQLRCYCLIHISLHFYYARSVFVGRHIGCLPNILDMHIGVFVQHIFEP